jgi:hypothetical protein
MQPVPLLNLTIANKETSNMSDPTILITLQQAQTALDCIDRDMDYSTHEQPDYHDLSEMLHNLRRVELRQRLTSAINAMKETK